MASTLPLTGVKVIELPGLAPVPFCGLILADFGADVLFIEKIGDEKQIEQKMSRGKRKMIINFNSSTGVKQLKRLCADADVLLDPYRPGVLEGMGLDPVQLLKENPKLIIARLSSYGQFGPLARNAGHDINFLALSGIMPSVCGENLIPPANLLGDFAGGSLMAAFGISSALFRRTKNGNRGCVLDCSMTEGIAYLGTFISMYSEWPLLCASEFSMCSGKCPIYKTYETKDSKFMAVGALEPKFHVKLFNALGLNGEKTAVEMFEDPVGISQKVADIFKSKTQEEWTKIFQEADACVTPVLGLDEVGDFEHHKRRRAFEKSASEDGQGKSVWMPKPTPRIYSGDEFAKLQIKTVQKSKL